MKKVVIITIATLFTVAYTYAQNVSIGVKGGLSIPNLTSGGKEFDTPLSEGYSSRMVGGGGIDFEFHLTEIFSIQTGLEYSTQGGMKKGIQALPGQPFFDAIRDNIGQQPGGNQLLPIFNSLPLPQDGAYVYADIKSVAKFNYLMLPLQAKFRWKISESSPLDVYVSGGIFGSYLLSAKRDMSGTSAMFADENATTMSNYWNNIYPALPLPEPIVGVFSVIFTGMDTPQSLDNKTDIKNEIHPFNFGIIGSIGLSYSLGARHRIFLEGGGNYGFLTIQKDDMNGRNRIGAATIMIGISRTFGKNI